MDEKLKNEELLNKILELKHENEQLKDLLRAVGVLHRVNPERVEPV